MRGSFVFGMALIAAQIWLSYALIAGIFKWLTVVLFAYVITAFIVHPPWPRVLLDFVIPDVHFDAGWLSTVVGVLGTTITPYLFFWQASLMVENEKEDGKTTIRSRRGTDEQSIADARRHQRRHDLLEPGRVLHHRDDGRNAGSPRQARHCNGPGCGASVAPARRQLRGAPVHPGDGRDRNLGGPGAWRRRRRTLRRRRFDFAKG